jgi:hypothetical protein
VQAYELIIDGSWRLQDSGLGVICRLVYTANQSGWGKIPIGIEDSSVNADQAKGQLGLQSLLNFQ